MARKVQGGPIQPVYVVSDAELDSGRFRLANGPVIPVSGFQTTDKRRVKGGPAIPVYVVSDARMAEGRFRLQGGPAVPMGNISMLGMDRRVGGGDVAIPVYVEDGLLSSGGGGAGVGTNPGTTELKAWWSLDEASGARSDSHGSNDLTDNGSVGQAVGVVGNAASFGGNESLSIADNADFSITTTDFTLAMWVRFDSYGSFPHLAGKWGNSGEEWFVRLKGSSSTALFSFFVIDSDVNFIELEADTPATVELDTWYLITAWYNGSNINIEVNNGVAYGSAHNTGVRDLDGPFTLGERGTGSGDLLGRLDEVSFWHRALTADEREWMYNNGSGRSYSDLA